MGIIFAICIVFGGWAAGSAPCLVEITRPTAVMLRALFWEFQPGQVGNMASQDHPRHCRPFQHPYPAPARQEPLSPGQASRSVPVRSGPDDAGIYLRKNSSGRLLSLSGVDRQSSPDGTGSRLLAVYSQRARKGTILMFANDVYLWPVYAALGGTTIIGGLRCLTLFVGLRLALRGAPKADRVTIFREFARAVGARGPTGEHGPRQPAAGRDNAWHEIALPHNGSNGGYPLTCAKRRRGYRDVRQPGNPARHGQSSRSRSHA
jgi:hypothetical protein